MVSILNPIKPWHLLGFLLKLVIVVFFCFQKLSLSRLKKISIRYYHWTCLKGFKILYNAFVRRRVSTNRILYTGNLLWMKFDCRILVCVKYQEKWNVQKVWVMKKKYPLKFGDAVVKINREKALFQFLFFLTYKFMKVVKWVVMLKNDIENVEWKLFVTWF